MCIANLDCLTKKNTIQQEIDKNPHQEIIGFSNKSKKYSETMILHYQHMSIKMYMIIPLGGKTDPLLLYLFIMKKPDLTPKKTGIILIGF